MSYSASILKIIFFTFFLFISSDSGAHSDSLDQKFSDAINKSAFDFVLWTIETRSGVLRSEFDSKTLDEATEFAKNFSDTFLQCFSNEMAIFDEKNIYVYKITVIESKNFLLEENFGTRMYEKFKQLNNYNGEKVACKAGDLTETTKECQMANNFLNTFFGLPFASKKCAEQGTTSALKKKLNKQH